MNKKIIVIGSIVVFAIIILVVGINSKNTDKNTPEKLAIDYVNALNEKDYEKIYELGKYGDLNGDKKFISKEIVLKTLENTYKEYESIGDFSISEGMYSENENSVRFSIYPINSEYSSPYEASLFGGQENDIILTKSNTNRYKSSGEWIIQELDEMIVENYKITVPKNIKINFQGVDVDKKYLLKENATEDIYQLPLVLNYETDIIFEYQGFKFANKITPYSDGYQFSEENIPDEFEAELREIASSFLENLINGVAENKSWNEIRKTLNLRAEMQSRLKNIYGENIEEKDIENSIKEIKASYAWGDGKKELNAENSLYVQYMENYFNTKETKPSTSDDEVKELKKLYEIEREGLLNIDKSEKDTAVALKDCIVLPDEYRSRELSINNQNYIYLKANMNLKYKSYSNNEWWDRSKSGVYTFLFKVDKDNGIELVNIDDILLSDMVYLIKHDNNVIEGE